MEGSKQLKILNSYYLKAPLAKQSNTWKEKKKKEERNYASYTAISKYSEKMFKHLQERHAFDV